MFGSGSMHYILEPQVIDVSCYLNTNVVLFTLKINYKRINVTFFINVNSYDKNYSEI